MGAALKVSYDLPEAGLEKTASDHVFYIAHFLADFAFDNGMKEVSNKLEDVLDAVLAHEQAQQERLPNVAQSAGVSPRLRRIMADVIARQKVDGI